jgi:predicted Zn finger-like uncharacterized protein
MVKVECHGCSAPYQIDERRIPPAGLKMRCPKCGTSLLVNRPGQDAGAAAPPSAPAVDLPAVPAPRAPAPPPPPRPLPAAPPPGAFGEIDFPSVAEPAGAGFGDIGLPRAAPARPVPPAPPPAAPPAPPAPFGSVDLPSPFGAAPAAPLAPQAPSMPVAAAPFSLPPLGGPPGGGAFGALDLGIAGGAEVGLPTTAPTGSGLPVPSAGGSVGLPIPGFGGVGPSGTGLPMPSQPVGLPSLGGPSGLPTLAGGTGLPSISAGGGLLPVVGSETSLPTASPGLPMPVGGMGGPQNLLPSPAGIGLPERAAGGEFDFSNPDALPPVPDAPEAGAEIGAEIELDGGQGTIAADILAAKRERVAPAATTEEPQGIGRGTRVAAVLLALLGLGGASLAFVPDMGPFGYNFISDRLNADAYAKSHEELRRAVQADLDEDNLRSVAVAAQKVRAAHEQRPRHQETAAYAAYVLYLQTIRFGRETASDAVGKLILDNTKRELPSFEQKLATAAQEANAGQLARARQLTQEALSLKGDDVDAAVLAAEIELLAKEPKAAIEAFTKAVAIQKSARTVYGLARAQLAAGMTAEAEATAKSALELAKSHVGARTLLASVAVGSLAREPEALKLLEEITKDDAVRTSASQAELVETYIQLGRVHLVASRVSQAQEAFGEARKLNPQAVAALVGSGELFYRAGRFSEAEASFESALRADADNLDAKIGMAKTWIGLERLKEVKDLITKTRAAHPKEARVAYWAGRTEELLGKRKDAEALYREAMTNATAPETAIPAVAALAHLIASNGQTDEAQKLLVEAATKYPDSPELARARGDVELQSGNYNEARTQFEAALKRAPDDLATRFSLGVTLRRMRNFAEANAVFEAVAKVDKEYPGLAIERGLYFEETGQSDQALAMYNEALQKAPNDVDLKLRIGSTQVAAGHTKQAEPILKEVIRERPNSAEANHFLGRAMLLGSTNLNESMRYLKRAVEIDGNRAEYHLYVGWAANEAGQPGLAEQSLTRAIELDSSLGDAHWQKGVLLQKQGRATDAIKELEIALEKRPSRYEAHATMALCFEELVDLPKANDAWQRAIKGNDKVADWHYRRGKLLDRQGDAKSALAELELAIEQGEKRDNRPGWMADAHFLVAETYRPTAKEKAIYHFQEFLRLAPPDNAYRVDATRALEELKP